MRVGNRALRKTKLAHWQLANARTAVVALAVLPAAHQPERRAVSTDG